MTHLSSKLSLGVILLARMKSSRMPGKVLVNVSGKSIIEHILERVSRLPDRPKIVVATSVEKQDDAIEYVCSRTGVEVFRGSENNVLHRCREVVEQFGFDVVVRIGADTPFFDWQLVGSMIRRFFDVRRGGTPLEYLSNCMHRSYPIGLDADIMLGSLFKVIAERIEDFPERERSVHESNVISYIHQRPDAFAIESVRQEVDMSRLRWTLDTPDDYRFISEVYAHFQGMGMGNCFLMEDILALLEKRPELQEINIHTVPLTGFWSEEARGIYFDRYKAAIDSKGIKTEVL